MNASKGFLRKIVAILRETFSVEVIDATALTTPDRRKELDQVTKERQGVTKVLREVLTMNPVPLTAPIVSTTVPEVSIPDPTHWNNPMCRYNLEYLTAPQLRLTGQPCQFSGTHYWHYSPILEDSILRPLLGTLVEKEVQILEVGCGNGQLLSKLVSMGVAKRRLTGIDISLEANNRVRELGIDALWRLDMFSGYPKHLPASMPLSLIFLSYFVDRDNDQRATFREASRILHVHGTLILEGLFPCVMTDSMNSSYGQANVTKGRDEIEDIQLVVAELDRFGLVLEKIIVGQRLVYSIDGPEVLPTYILIFNKLPKR